MKLRLGFVSNSSSSSFVLDKTKLTVQQLHKIMHAVQSDNASLWKIDNAEGQDFLRLFTWQDNLCLAEVIESVDAADAVVYGEHQHADWKTGLPIDA